MKVVKTYKQAWEICYNHQVKVHQKDKSLDFVIDVSKNNEVRLLVYKTPAKKIRKRRYELTVGYEE